MLRDSAYNDQMDSHRSCIDIAGEFNCISRWVLFTEDDFDVCERQFSDDNCESLINDILGADDKDVGDMGRPPRSLPNEVEVPLSLEVREARTVALEFIGHLQAADSGAALNITRDACGGAIEAIRELASSWSTYAFDFTSEPAYVSTINADLVMLPTTSKYPPSLLIIRRLDEGGEWQVSGLSFGCAYDPPSE